MGNNNVVKIPIFGVTHWIKHRITRKLFKIDRYMMYLSYMLRGVWQALNCLSIHATYCMIVVGASPGETKCGLRYVKTAFFCTCGSNNWETVEYRCVHAARGFTSIELSSHPCNILRDNRRGVSRRNKSVGCGTWKRRFFALAAQITGKLLKIDGYMLRGIWQALNCLFIHATFCVIVAGASPGQTKSEGRGT